MPYVIGFSNDAVAVRHMLVAESLGLDVRGMSDEAAGLRAADASAVFSRDLGLPRSFREVGAPESDLAARADLALSHGAIVYNVKPATDAAEILGVPKAARRGVS